MFVEIASLSKSFSTATAFEVFNVFVHYVYMSFQACHETKKSPTNVALVFFNLFMHSFYVSF